ncbi:MULTISPECIES: 3-isopropylmalate dehydratase large subunit [Desulfococcus]|jgi:3-isopropylmalate/(R)-2-methylmalate dehydratase large subunit|uniref:3-isopropylmalate dehydratase large subunit n=1 Tax=Desulfococcus multivorans DSM 2059 TaxID=1121405 RepID=S7TCB3_DESML|nr:3-isopropylmalate dehydratase large subunit [Desulfococcus multivorans]AOY60173.1 LeuC: 3-isopropylmalate dehydratase, large subunit [Desulfococcus multivorans]AQV02302.1 3-isopropylmalate dehydratase large subunit [Desulfococcus multivorans]EPR34246.1 3-isopropylmalate dehydratase large subunit [Desulfococcus multivorans DSM 2059]SKA06208.1 3-isopropylmalate dehydratase, large subunit [Desulfococcus multivorans DSM 2059]
MGMTITEKILAAHAGVSKVSPGDLIMARVDVALGNDITAPIAIKAFRESGAKKVFDKDRVILVPDHFVPNKDIASAMQVKLVREFAREQELTWFFDAGEMGVEHALLPEQGLVLPGDLVIGADSHTCTYGGLGAFSTGVGSTDLAAAMITGEVWLRVPESIRFVYEGTLNPWVEGKDLILYTIGDIGVDGALYQAMEFTGPVIEALSVEGRLTMANMAIEAGGKNGIIAPDALTEAFVQDRAVRDYTPFHSDPDAGYARVITYDVGNIEPQVAFPHLPENTRGISEVGEVVIDQAVIGSCTNGRIEDLRSAARVLTGNRAAKGVRLIVIPATPTIYRQAMDEGLFEIFMNAGAIISPPTCGPCLGGHMGILAKGERAIATTNRNFVGRMGHPESEVYLSNPAVAAASAIAGKIVGPDRVA